MRRLPPEVLETIGAEVRRRREAAGHSLEAMAARTRLHERYLRDVELGQADLSLSSLWAVATALQCQVADILPAGKHGLTADIAGTARMLTGVDPELRAAAMRLIGPIPGSRRPSRGR
ncbi:MAG: helix-turn-helix domain-containing protein [Polyangiaceae bacterium]|nr:helix-turn-helix domain-containing protein [Polyangiaceae bacterium]